MPLLDAGGNSMATTQTPVRTIPGIFYEDPEPVEDHMLLEEPFTPL